MARRKTKKKEKPYIPTPASIAKQFCANYEDAHFAVLVACGFSYAEAYRLVFPTNATTASVASMASKKVRDITVQRVLYYIRQDYWNGSLKMRDDYVVTMKVPAWCRIPKRERCSVLHPKKE